MNREEIRKKIVEFSLNQEELYIKEWNTKVVIKELTGEDFIQLAELALENGSFSKSKFLTLMIIKSTYIDGELLFTLEDYETVKTLPVNIYSALVNSVSKLNDMEKSKN